MDDAELYGPVLYELGLMESIERGILASFEIDVLEIRDPKAPDAGASDEEVRGRRLAALLKHADATGSRSLMTFHTRTLDAMAFARALPETAAELHESDPTLYPKRVGAEWLCGEHAAGHRRAVLDHFADGLDPEGWVNDFQVLAVAGCSAKASTSAAGAASTASSSPIRGVRRWRSCRSPAVASARTRGTGRWHG